MADADKPNDKSEDETERSETGPAKIEEGADGNTLDPGTDVHTAADAEADHSEDSLEGEDTLEPASDYSASPVGEEVPMDDDSVQSADTTDTVAGDTSETDTLTTRDDTTDTSAAVATAPTTERVVERRGGFFPMLLGGVVAAAIGFGLSQYLGPTGWPFSNTGSAFEEETRGALSETRSGLEAISSRIDGVETGLSEVDLGSVETSVADLTSRTAELGTQLTAATQMLNDLSSEIEGLRVGLGTVSEDAVSMADRVTALERAPMEEAVSPETVAAYERELADLQSAVEEQRAAMDQAAADQQAALDQAFADQQAQIEEQRAELQAMLENANQAEANAERAAQIATLRAAAADLVSAVRTGEPYASALEPLSAAESVDVPEALSGPAADGVPTQSELQESFPDAARDALAAARAEAPADEGGNRLASFMASQLGARSVTPREGDSADAILSRAEAAVDGGDLQTALDEISALPQAAQDAMSDWIDQATTRAEALGAADSIAQQLNEE